MCFHSWVVYCYHVVYIVVLHHCTRAYAIAKKVHKVTEGYRKLAMAKTREARAFVDDIVICVEGERHLEYLGRTGRRKRKINLDKTVVMMTGEESKMLKIEIKGEQIEQMDSL